MGIPLIAGTAVASAAPLVAKPLYDRVTGGNEPEEPQLFGYPRKYVIGGGVVALGLLALVVMRG